ncbi:ATP-binding protein [Streptomyces sp. NPDC059076]|uniref:ATP-binding protein n=1 Tax=unclassified Streptomyces TaxID=2593676 RepID=UPI003681B089
MHDQPACRYVLEVQASAQRIPQVRRILAAHLRHWALDVHVPPVCRAVDELIGNVVHHARGDKTCEVELRWTGRQLVVSVADRDHRMPQLTGCCPPKGGLATVALLSDSWGTCATPSGKVVWFSRYIKEAQRVGLGDARTAPAAPEANPLPGTPPGGVRTTTSVA